MVVGEAVDGFGDLERGLVHLDAFPLPPPSTQKPCTSLSGGQVAMKVELHEDTNTLATPTAATHAAAAIHPDVQQQRPKPTNGHAGSSRLLAVDKALPSVPRPGSVSFDLPTRNQKPRPLIHRSVSAISFNSPQFQVGDAGRPSTPSGRGSTSIRYLPSEPTPESPLPLFAQAFPSSGEDAQYPPSPVCDDSRRRSRGLSLGPLSFFSLNTTDQKAKEKETTHEGLPKGSQTAQSSPKPTLSHKSSFWRKTKTAPSSTDDSPRQSIALSSSPSPRLPPQLPPLPNLSSLAPFGLEDVARGIVSTFSLKAGRRLSSRRHSIESLSHLAGPSSPSRANFDERGTQVSNAAGQVQASLSASPPIGLPDIVPFPGSDTEHGLFPSLDSFSKRRRAQTNPTLALSDSALPRLTVAAPSPSSHSRLDLSSGRNSLRSSRAEFVPKPDADEAADIFLERVRIVVPKGDLATALASSPEPVYSEALRLYLTEFEFDDEPLDIALRKLLMAVGLPRETQQIDRVVEAFSHRYSQCNPGLFSSDDQAYILAFSLIMLHTDAFNPSNKTKMTKLDYIKNTTLPGVYPEVLGCFFDNVTFSPFIFIEDPLDGGLSPDISKRTRTPITPSPAGMLGKPRIDPYYLIANNLLESMKADLEKIIPVETPFNFQGPGGINCSQLQATFSNAQVLQVEVPEKRPAFTMSMSEEGLARSSGESVTRTKDLAPDSPSINTMTLKTVKIGVLNRKDDITGRGKRAAVRKWKAWTVLLTTSQILFFRDTDMKNRLPGISEAASEDEVVPRSVFKPDDILPLKDCIALYDSSYVKHDHTIRLVLTSGRQILLKASDPSEADHWLSCINYASALKSAGVRPRPIAMSQSDICLTGVAAATSHLHDLQSQSSPHPALSRWDTNTPSELMGMLSGTAFNQRPSIKHRLAIPSDDLLDLENISSIQSARTEQFKTTFNGVKADLNHQGCLAPGGSSSRQDLVRQKVRELEQELDKVQSELASETRFLRNVAILRPLQRATRTKLVAAVQSFVASKKIIRLRIEWQRLACHGMVLRDDLEAELESLASMKSIALDAAKRSLEQRDSIPRMSISVHDDERTTPPPGSAHSLTRSTSSDSFHSALEYAADWPLDDLYFESGTVSRSPSQAFDSPRPSTSSSTRHLNGLVPGERSSSLSSSLGGGSLKDLTKSAAEEEEAEEAEPWNRTRAAKRVSLIRVPSSVTFHSKRTGR